MNSFRVSCKRKDPFDIIKGIFVSLLQFIFKIHRLIIGLKRLDTGSSVA